MSTAAIPVHVALVDQTGKIDPAEMAKVAGAMNSQIQNDFAPVWKVAATVGAYPAVPEGTWAVIIQETLDQQGALGYHTDSNNQPVAYVEYEDDGSWTVTVSHETLEMLADPWGNRVTAALLPEGVQPSQIGLKSDSDPVAYLLEACDPPENYSYPIGGVDVSDFLLPPWYRSAAGPGVHYSHTGAITEPREVADGGYVSFGLPTGEWWQVFNEGGTLSVQDLGKFNASTSASLREWADAKAREYRASKSE